MTRSPAGFPGGRLSAEREFTGAYHKLGVLLIPPRTAKDRHSRTDCSHSAFGGSWPRTYRIFLETSLLGARSDYGSLTHQRLEDMRTTEDESQIDSATEAGRRSVRDFCLVSRNAEEPVNRFVDSPWGRGRPGWQSASSKMSYQLLGETFDIRRWRIDSRNEQAQF